MKALAFFFFLAFLGCSQLRGPTPLAPNVAQDSMANGNIQATAIRTVKGQDACFDITVHMKGVPQREATPYNWTVAWIDQNSRYHLLGLNQRDPASVPEGSNDEWTNTFRTCAPQFVKTLVLNPKELSIKEIEGMTLEWK